MINDDPLPFWMEFDQSTLIFSAKPQRGHHTFNKTRISIEARNKIGEIAKTSFVVEFENRAPKTPNTTIKKNLRINQEYSILLMVYDDDGDPIKCLLDGEKPSYLELDPIQCKLILSPQPADDGKETILNVIAYDEFGGSTGINLTLKVDSTYIDLLNEIFKKSWPYIISFVVFLASYHKSGFIWNLIICWSRTKNKLWDPSKKESFRILTDYYPGWIFKDYFTPRVTSKNIHPKLRCYLIRKILSFATVIRMQCFPKKRFVPDEEVRRSYLIKKISSIRVFAFEKKSWKNYFPFLDYFTRKELKGAGWLFSLSNKDFTISLSGEKKNEISYAQDSLGNEFFMKILIFSPTGRILEKIVLERFACGIESKEQFSNQSLKEKIKNESNNSRGNFLITLTNIPVKPEDASKEEEVRIE
jgi:hypothetical protein